MSDPDRSVQAFCQDRSSTWRLLGILPLREALQAVGGTEATAMLRALHDALPAPSAEGEDLRLYGRCRLASGDWLPPRLYGAAWQLAFDGCCWIHYARDPIARCPACGVLREVYSVGIGRGYKCQDCDTPTLRPTPTHRQ